MNKIILGVGIFILAGVGLFAVTSSSGSNSDSPAKSDLTQAEVSNQVAETTTGSSQSSVTTITYTNQGFDPNLVGPLQVGSTVNFVNNSDRDMWVASNVHPAHTILPEFDALGGTKPGDSYQFTFDKIGNWRFHDHLNASHTGTVQIVSGL